MQSIIFFHLNWHCTRGWNSKLRLSWNYPNWLFLVLSPVVSFRFSFACTTTKKKILLWVLLFVHFQFYSLFDWIIKLVNSSVTAHHPVPPKRRLPKLAIMHEAGMLSTSIHPADLIAIQKNLWFLINLPREVQSICIFSKLQLFPFHLADWIFVVCVDKKKHHNISQKLTMKCKTLSS